MPSPSSISSRAVRSPSSKIWLFVDSIAEAIASGSGTPARIMAEMMRQKRSTAEYRTMSPMTGSLQERAVPDAPALR